VQTTRQLGEGSERALPFAFFLLGLFLGILLGLPIEPPLLAFLRHALLLGAGLNPPLLGLLGVLFLLALLDDGRNHVFERGLVNAEPLTIALGPIEIERPLARRHLRRRQPLDLGLEPTRALL